MCIGRSSITELLARRGVFLQATHKRWMEVGSERAVAAAIAMHISSSGRGATVAGVLK